MFSPKSTCRRLAPPPMRVGTLQWEILDLPLPGIAQSKEIITPTHISYAEHVLYDPFAKGSVEGNMIRKYIPVSPRNCIMYFLATFKEGEMYQILRYLLGKDNGNDDLASDYVPPDVPRVRKKRKHSSRLISVTHRSILS